MSYTAVILFGAPGVGKGTQGRILGAIPGMFHVSSGEIFRALDPNSPEGRSVHSYTSRGELVPDELTVRIWSNWLEQQQQAGRFVPTRDLLILDGLPRNPQQCRMIEDLVEVLQVIHLVCRDEAAVVGRIRKRALQEGRIDDASEEIIRRRFEVYRRESAPVLAYYPDSLIHEVDAIGLPAEVLYRILDGLVPVLRERFTWPGD